MDDQAFHQVESTNRHILDIQDISELAVPWLSAKAKEALKVRAIAPHHTNEDGRYYRTLYLGNLTRKGNALIAVEHISSVLNELAEAGDLHSCLAPLSTMQMARMPLRAPYQAVFCFVLVPADRYEALMNKYPKCAMHEGTNAIELEDLSPELADGEFLAEVRFTHGHTLMLGFDSEKYVKQEIDRYLAFLPKGTVVREVNDTAVMDLCITKEVKFYNPLMQRIKYVEVDFVREFASFDEPTEINGQTHQIHQFVLIKEYRYLDKDKKNIHLL
jgi:hypothetical protein